MTHEEVANKLRHDMKESDVLTAEEKDMISFIVEALEKQIPKKPKDYDSVPHHRCPNCNSAIRVYCDDPYDPVCKFCGQAIDWSDI